MITALKAKLQKVKLDVEKSANYEEIKILMDIVFYLESAISNLEKVKSLAEKGIETEELKGMLDLAYDDEEYSDGPDEYPFP